MRLHVKITLLDAGTPTQAGPSEMLACPADVESDTVRSFLVQHFEDPVDVARMPTERHQRLAVGWIFPVQETSEAGTTLELLCVPFADATDGSLPAMFEMLADQRQDLELLAATGFLDSLTVVEARLR
jgi:hypothetical protein